MKNPYVDILYHPTGRIIQKRKLYELDMKKVIENAVKEKVALEINSFPDRLDLRDEYIRMAVDAGAKLVINTDSHHKDHLKYIKFGIGQARRGWAESKNIINSLELADLKKQLNKNK